MLLNVLEPAVTRKNNKLQDCIAPEKVLSLGLYHLAYGNSYKSIGPNFILGRSNVLEAVQEVVEALFNLRNVYIKFLITEAGTPDVSDLPNIVGAIGGSYIRIAARQDSAVDYFSRYQQHDFIVQAIVDCKKRCFDYTLAFPGSTVLC